MGQTNVLDTVMQTGLVTLQTESQPQDTFLCSVVDQSRGAAKSKNVWHFPLQKQSMLHYLELLKNACG